MTTSGAQGGYRRPKSGLNLFVSRRVESARSGDFYGGFANDRDRNRRQTAQLQKQYDDAHRPKRPLEAYRRRHARRHPKLDYDGEELVPQYRGRG